MSSAKFSLGRADRLKSRKLIQQLFSQGKMLTGSGISIVYMQMTEQPGILRAAFGVSKKNFRKAVKRNHIRRMMKEVYRTNKPVLSRNENGPGMILFLNYTGREVPDFGYLERIIGEVLAKLAKKIA